MRPDGGHRHIRQDELGAAHGIGIGTAESGAGEALEAAHCASAAVYAAGVIGNAWASRGRHFGWAWLSVVVGRALAGL